MTIPTFPVPGDKALSIEAVDQNGETRTLEEFAGRSILLYFYPKAMSPGCTTSPKDTPTRLLAALKDLS